MPTPHTRILRKSTRRKSWLHTYGVIALLVASIGFQFAGNIKQGGHVLPYATSVSAAGLQQAQNSQRLASGISALSLNTQLSSAAQAKANDMVARNYWSHNTPEGNTPWVFITNAGYSYYKAGENLAYGFLTSDGVVTGWMNSASHRANVLDATYKDVGFGIASGASYQGGENTVVVAMYAQPAAVIAPPAPVTPKVAPKVSPTPAPTPVAPSPTPAPAPTPTPTPPSPTPVPEADPDTSEPNTVTTESNLSLQPVSSKTTLFTSLRHGGLKWTAVASLVFTMVALGWFAIKHTLAFKRAVVDGEEFVLTHPAVEVALLSIAMLLLFAGTSGYIR